jgi:hypothetical protein
MSVVREVPVAFNYMNNETSAFAVASRRRIRYVQRATFSSEDVDENSDGERQ